MKPPRYCEECGQQLPILKNRKRFSPDTGGPVEYYGPCPTGKCNHFGVDHDAVRPKPQGFMGWVKALLRGNPRQCTKCGETVYDPVD